MAGISLTDLIDLQRTTTTNLPDMEFEVALNYQEYPVCNQWFAKDKKQLSGGTSIERNIILDTSGNAKHVRLYQKTPINVTDVQKKVTAPWVQAQTHYSIERREALDNRKPSKYIDLLKSRRVDATLDMADLLEEKAWATPTDSSDDLNPRGVPYYISHLNDGTTSAGAFSGQTIRYGDGTTSTTKAGIDGSTSTNSKWRNWAATYTTINGEFVKRLRKAFHATNFKSPVTVKDLDSGPRSRFRLYMALEELNEYEDLVTKSNDNLGRDLDPFHGATTFKRVPITYTPQLDTFTITGGSGTSNSSAPVFGINHYHFYPYCREGDWMRESDPMVDVEQHNVITTFVDCSYQYFCRNIRAGGFVLHKTVTA